MCGCLMAGDARSPCWLQSLLAFVCTTVHLILVMDTDYCYGSGGGLRAKNQANRS